MLMPAGQQSYILWEVARESNAAYERGAYVSWLALHR